MKWLRVLALGCLAFALIATLYVQWQESQKDIRMMQKATELMKEAGERSWGKNEKK